LGAETIYARNMQIATIVVNKLKIHVKTVDDLTLVHQLKKVTHR